VLVAAGPNWLGSPQHVAGGAVLAFAVTVAARRFNSSPWWAAAIAVGVTSATEILLKLAEYIVIVHGTVRASAYYDSLVDNVSTLFGGVVGALIAVFIARRKHRDSERPGA
jgi:hypothetical protein